MLPCNFNYHLVNVIFSFPVAMASSSYSRVSIILKYCSLVKTDKNQF